MTTRLRRYARAATELALHSDTALASLVAGAAVLGDGMGGVASVMDVDGVPVFVKRIAVTDRERDAAWSTANLFNLPPFFQYGVGSPGLGAWRELAANVMTTNWVLSGQSAAFPLMYHWRVLPGDPPATSPDGRDQAYWIDFWGGSTAVRDRLAALAQASTSLVLFLEYIPHVLVDWLPTLSREELVPAYVMVERGLREAVTFMNSAGLHHFDVHYGNVLTDGSRIYIADLGLATSHRFDLSPAEAAFLDHHRSHDAGYVAMGLVNWLATNVWGIAVPSYAGSPARNEFVRRCAEGYVPPRMPAELAAILSAHAPLAAVMNDFYWELFGTRRDPYFPAELVRPLVPLRAPLAWHGNIPMGH
jgi:hypothetical protein